MRKKKDRTQLVDEGRVREKYNIEMNQKGEERIDRMLQWKGMGEISGL